MGRGEVLGLRADAADTVNYEIDRLREIQGLPHRLPKKPARRLPSSPPRPYRPPSHPACMEKLVLEELLRCKQAEKQAEKEALFPVYFPDSIRPSTQEVFIRVGRSARTSALKAGRRVKPAKASSGFYSSMGLW